MKVIIKDVVFRILFLSFIAMSSIYASSAESFQNILATDTLLLNSDTGSSSISLDKSFSQFNSLNTNTISQTATSNTSSPLLAGESFSQSNTSTLSTISQTVSSSKRTSSIKKKKKKKKKRKAREIIIDSLTIQHFQIFNYPNRIISPDTTLTVEKEYTTNYLRKDMFNLLPFSNIGQAYNRLAYDFSESPNVSQQGFRAKDLAYISSDEVNYYEVPKPLSELFFRTTIIQGQLANSFITVNTSPQFNFNISYRGLRSQGHYVNQLSTSETFITSFTVRSMNQKYLARVHYANQNFSNEENGGISISEIVFFEDNDPDFQERTLFRSVLSEGQSNLLGKRSFFNQQFSLISPVSKTTNTLQIILGHQFQNETKRYQYSDSRNEDFFGEVINGAQDVIDQSKWALVENEFYTQVKAPYLGVLKAGISVYNTQYSSQSGNGSSTLLMPEFLSDSQLFFKSDWNSTIKSFSLKGSFAKTLSAGRQDDFIRASSKVNVSSQMNAQAQVSFRSYTPDYVFVLNKSQFEPYNWYNPGIENQKNTTLSVAFSHKKWGSLKAQIQQLQNYTYFQTQESSYTFSENTMISDLTNLIVSPQQYTSQLNYLKLRYHSEFQFGKFQFNNDILYQQVNSTTTDSDEMPLNVPKWNIRSTFSFSSYVFNDALFMNAGITAQYFSAFYADNYIPLLSDFAQQQQVLIGNYPRVNLYANGRIKSARVYLKWEHLNAGYSGFQYYSAPNYPYRDRIIRFGVVWNFFD